MKHPTTYNLDYDQLTPLQKSRGINPSMSSHQGNQSVASKIMLNRYNLASGGISMTGPSTVPMMKIPT